MISKPERRLAPRRAILIKDDIPARAVWIRSILQPFVARNAELFLSAQRVNLKRRSDIVILGDPLEFRGQVHPAGAPVATLRYTFTRQAWHTMLLSTPQGAVVRVASGAGIASVLRNAFDQLQRPDIQVKNVDDGVTDADTWRGPCRLQIRAREASSDVLIEREIDLPVIAPGVVFSLVRRLGRLNGETHQAMRQYLCSAAPVVEDSEILLDTAVGARECLDKAASMCNQVVIHLDGQQTVVDVSGPLEFYFDRRTSSDILGRSIADILPDVTTMVACTSGLIEKSVSINGQPTLLRMMPLARKPKRTLVILTRSMGLEAVGQAVVHGPPARAAHYRITDIVGRSPAIERARQLALRAGRTESPVLIIGESGTGKELFAQAMHNLSRRAAGPFVPINCAAIPESLMETELFGYEDGAFTGASRKGRASLFERAHRGTLFLDELGDLSLHAQAALLRVLEEGTVTRVGGNRAVHVDIRVIGAVNRPLEGAIDEGTFRRDLYHRLCVIPLWIPPLSERPQDIPVLAQDFLEALGDSRAIPAEILDYFFRYRWPGNVRELQHCLTYMATITDEPFTLADLPPHIQPYVQINDYDREPDRSASKTVRADLDAHSFKGQRNFPSLQDDCCLAILGLIGAANHSGTGIGRRGLREKVIQEGFALTERAIRKRLRALRADGLIEWRLGRSGVSLTANGRKLWRHVGSA